MSFIIGLILGAIAGAVGAVIYYRRNNVMIEAALAEAVRQRKQVEEAYLTLKAKIGG
jgi:tetrahydromethanopterin S-methyltransferase subunit D